jgi:O-antigen/teichoic acid export membrane protein
MSASWRPNFRFSTQSLKDVSRFGLYASGNRVIQIMSIDQILIGTLMGPAPLGIFGFSKRIFQMLNDVIAGVLNSVSYALLSSLQTEKEKLREAFLIVTFASSAFSFPLFIGLASVSNDLVPLVFGPQWLEAVPSLQGFCVLGLLSCIGVLQSTLINSQGRADWWLYYVAAKQVLTIAIILYFYRYGVTAMVIAIAIQNFVMWPAAVHLVLKVLGMTMSRYLAPFIGPSLATLGMFLYILLMQNLLSSWTPLSRLPLIIISAALVYTVILGVYDRRRVKDMYLILRKRGKA